jgi:hypothetical protein
MRYRVLEIGAGDDSFARAFLEDACVTDRQYHRTLDVCCAAEALSFRDAVFEQVVVNNPYLFGFADIHGGLEFLRAVDGVLAPDGCLVVTGNRRNPYCGNIPIVRDCAQRVGYGVRVESVSAAREYPGHVFHTTDGRPTVPTLRVILERR